MIARPEEHAALVASLYGDLPADYLHPVVNGKLTVGAPPLAHHFLDDARALFRAHGHDLATEALGDSPMRLFAVPALGGRLCSLDSRIIRVQCWSISVPPPGLPIPEEQSDT